MSGRAMTPTSRPSSVTGTRTILLVSRISITSSTEADVEGNLAYTDLRGATHEWARWRMLTHVANHTTFHRGEIALSLTALGKSPGELDFLHFLRQRSART